MKTVPINLTYCGEDLNWEALAPEFFNIPYIELLETDANFINVKNLSSSNLNINQ